MAEDITPKFNVSPSAVIPGGAADPMAVDSSGTVSAGTMVQPKKEEFNAMGNSIKVGSNTFQQGFGDKIFKVSSLGMHLGAAEFADAPFSVDMTGAMRATSGMIGGNVLTATSLSSSNFVAGSSGWQIEATGDAEFNNVTIRNVVFTVVRTYNLADSPATWTKPTGLVSIDVEGWGGGGSGGSDNATAGGGGGGAYNKVTFLVSQLGSTEIVTVGAGGAAATNADGNAGGNSSFGSHVTFYAGGAGDAGTGEGGGGGGGINGIGGNAAADGGAGGGPIGGAAGTGGGSGGTSIFGGGGGGDGGGSGGNSVFGGGGGANGGGGNTAGTSYFGGGGGNGGNATATTGGTSVFGGNGGNGGDASPLPTAGAVPGGGGGGSASIAIASGAGGAGRIIVTEHY